MYSLEIFNVYFEGSKIVVAKKHIVVSVNFCFNSQISFLYIMARLAPIFLAFLINWYGLLLFKTKAVMCACAVLTSKRIFTLATYFVLLDTDLYPRRYRKTHWLVRNVIEVNVSFPLLKDFRTIDKISVLFQFLIGLYLIESFVTEFWYPLETGLYNSLLIAAKLIRVYSPKTGSIYKISSNIFDILTHKKAPTVTSIMVSAGFLCAALHGTRTIDFEIIQYILI